MNPAFPFRRTAPVLACCTLSLLAAPLAAAERESTTELDLVVVIGERIGMDLGAATSTGALGNKSLLDTPFSLSVIDADDIARRQATSLQQIFFNDPSVSSSSTSATTNWWGPQMRGMGVYNYYVDGVPMTLSWGGELPLEAVESVEALKGLAGFMYGFGSPGGVMKYQTKRPTQTPLFAVGTTWRNDSAVAASIDAGGRVGDSQRFGYRVSAGGETGEYYNTTGIRRGVVSVATDFRFTEDVTWRANLITEDNRVKHEPLYFYWDGYVGDALPEPTYNYRDVSVRNAFYDTETLIASTGVSWRLNDVWTADLSGGISRKMHRANKMFADMIDETGDYTGNVYNFGGLLRTRSAQLLLTGELQTGAVRHELVFGGAFQRSFDRWSTDFYYEPDFTGNLYVPQDYLVTRDMDFSLEPVSLDQRQHALFASDTLHFGRHWQAILGVRYTDYVEKDLDGDPLVESGYKTNPVTPTVALIYKPFAQVSFYGSFVEALEPGGRVSEQYENRNELLEPTTSRQFEVGSKYDDGYFGFTAAAFRIECAATIDETRADGDYLTQDGLSVFQGIEAMAEFSLTSRLRAGIGATWLDAKIQDVSEANAELEGNRPMGSSRWQAAANVSYTLPQLRGLSVHAGARYFGDAFYGDDNRVLIPDRTLVSVGAEYRTAVGGRELVVTGNVNNLFDRKYWELNTLGEGVNGALGLKLEW